MEGRWCEGLEPRREAGRCQRWILHTGPIFFPLPPVAGHSHREIVAREGRREESGVGRGCTGEMEGEFVKGLKDEGVRSGDSDHKSGAFDRGVDGSARLFLDRSAASTPTWGKRKGLCLSILRALAHAMTVVLVDPLLGVCMLVYAGCMLAECSKTRYQSGKPE